MNASLLDGQFADVTATSAASPEKNPPPFDQSNQENPSIDHEGAVFEATRAANVPGLINGERFSSAPSPKTLIAICSALAHSARRKACRDTWLQRLPGNVAAFFFVGRGYSGPAETDVIQVNAADDYASLPKKVTAMLRYVVRHFHFDYLFKCDDDTYVVADRLNELPGSDMCAFLWNGKTASGGAGYLLTRSLAGSLTGEIDESGYYEDVEVTLAARRLHASILSTKRLQLDHGASPAPDNEFITAHWCSPERLHLIDEGWRSTMIPRFPPAINKIVVAGLCGGPGTQMFQYSHALALARRCEAQLQLLWEGDMNSPNRSFSLGRFGLQLAEDLPPESEWFQIAEYGTYRPGVCEGIETAFQRSGRRVCHVRGYFQNERCFSDAAPDIRKLFSGAADAPLPSTHPNSVAVHVRRRDPLRNPQHILCDVTYYLTAMRILRGLIRNPRFFIFTDDPGWCRSAFAPFPGVTIHPGGDEESDFAAMKSCSAFIISNSTFSWWAAWLSGSDAVVCPSRIVSGLDWYRAPERWIQIPSGGVAPACPRLSVTGKPIFKQTWWDRNAIDRQAEYLEWSGDASRPSRVAVRERAARFGISSVLDCGCGYCEDYAEFQKMTPRVRYTGIDASSVFVDSAQARGLDVCFGYIENMTFGDREFDLVYFRHVVELLPHYDDALSEAIRVSRRFVAVVWYLAPGIDPDRIFYIPSDLMYQNTYNRSGIESFIKGVCPGASIEWQDIAPRECLLWIDLGLAR